MEFASKLRWAIVITIVLLALVLIGWGLFSIASNVFNRSSGPSDGFVETKEFSRSELASTNLVRFTVDGPVVANQEHRSYTIEVNENIVTMRAYRTYDNIIISQKSYQNNRKSDDTFLIALERLSATARKKGTTEVDDYAEKGVCATGRRFIIEFDEDVRRWATTCTIEHGTAGGPLRTSIFNLFKKQVPDFEQIRRDAKL